MRFLTPLLTTLALGCSLHPVAADSFDAPSVADTPEEAPAESKRLLSRLPETLDEHVADWFDVHQGRRLYVQLDRPMYRPGDSIWFKAWSLHTRDLGGDRQAVAMTVELVDPSGITVQNKRVGLDSGATTNDFVLPAAAAGGKWTVRSTVSFGGENEVTERDFVVSSYTAPRIDKTLDFVREAYGAGETVDALIELSRTTGEPLANHPVHALLQLNGVTLTELDLTTDDTGAVLVSGDLPDELATSDGLLTVLVEDGGVTESISRSIPIVRSDVQLAFFPEGGDLVQDLPGRMYFEATDAHGEPADIQGYVTDDTGAKVATFSSLHDGLGRFAYTPAAGRTYRAHITAPAGIADTFELPAALEAGCVLRTYDDVTTQISQTRVGVRCSSRQDVVVTGVLREKTVDSAVVSASPTREGVVYLDPPAEMEQRQGAMRVTVFDLDLAPLAERLVYRNAGRDLSIEITPDRDAYTPRDEVVLAIQTRDPAGKPVPAELALSVVDDAVLTLADDEEGHMLSRIYLAPDLVESPEDPGWYFDDEEEDAARGLDLVMGTKGYRRFEWAPVMTFDKDQALAQLEMQKAAAQAELQRQQYAQLGYAEEDEMVRLEARPRRPRLPRMAPRRAKEAPMAPPPMAPIPVAAPAPPMDGPMGGAPMPVEAPVVVADVMGGDVADMPMAEPMRDHRGLKGGPAAGKVMAAREARMWVDPNAAWAPVRVFPTPDYSAGFDGTRSDFRDTVHWAPSVKTDEHGEATVRFYLSDALTEFRVTAEGVGAAMAGHGEGTFVSKLPVSLDTKLPVAVASGDRIDLPVTVRNTRPEALKAHVNGTFGDLVWSEADAQGLKVAANSSDTVWMPLSVGQGAGETSIELSVQGGGLTDTVQKTIAVEPLGFPREWSDSGMMEKNEPSVANLHLEEWVDESLTARVTWHPSTVSNLMEGMEGLIREPGGCFEQTSSTNWPNVAILNYLEAHDGDPRLKVQSAQKLESGYKRLTGYQVTSGGFETFGNGPGKEVLSAFGLLQFHDMSNVYPVSDEMMAEDVEYLLSQRDGKGGFDNSGTSSHGFGSSPKPIGDGFITWALVASGHADELDAEIDQQADVAKTEDDPYVLALAARTLSELKHRDADTALKRLANMQAKDGSFPGAETSITHSHEANLDVETTALAAMALMDGGPRWRAQADKSAEWLVNARQGQGTWGATQATALALGALTRHAEVNTRPRTGGTLSVEVNGSKVATVAYEADQQEPIEITGLEDVLQKGDNRIVLRQKDGEPLPYSIDIQWHTNTPISDPGAELSVTTRLDRQTVPMGETVRMTAKVKNRTDDIVHSPIARIGLPAGLEAQTWQLEQLQERGTIAFFETRPREVTLYWEGLHADDTHEIALDLVAAIPGQYTGPATSAYPYYDDDEKAWDRALAIAITH